jgi:hypothetical protein
MLAERAIALKAPAMRRLIALLLLSALALVPAACRKQPQGVLRVVVIGGQPKLRDPALGSLPPPDAVLLQNVAQGLVQFDPTGNIVPGLAERWNVSDDGLSYIFRIESRSWPDGTKITAEQVARLLKRQLAERSRNPLRDSVGAIEDVVAMTDRVIEIRLLAPRPNLLSLLAQPEFAILKGTDGTGPFNPVGTGGPGGEIRLSRDVSVGEDEEPRHEQVLLAGAASNDAIADFAAGKTDLVLGGTFGDLPLAESAKLPRDALRFDPASGLFGLIPVGGRSRELRFGARRTGPCRSCNAARARPRRHSALSASGLVRDPSQRPTARASSRGRPPVWQEQTNDRGRLAAGPGLRPPARRTQARLGPSWAWRGASAVTFDGGLRTDR